MTARGIRNNNPGNIKDFGIPWNGLCERDQMTEEQKTETLFCVFSGPLWGIRAMTRILINYQDRHGLDSIHKIISRWAPGSDNNQPAKYALFVADHVGVSVYETIDVHDHDIMRKLVSAIVQYENGSDPYTWQYEAGLIMAGSSRMDDLLRRDRKFKSFLLVFVVASLMLTFGKVTNDQWVMITGSVFGLFMAGNVGEHYSKRGE